MSWFQGLPTCTAMIAISGFTGRGFRIMIWIKHRFVSSSTLLAATPHSHQSFYKELEHHMSLPALSFVLI